MGPRQVGKSTLTGQVLDKLGFPNLYVSADAVANSGESWLEQQWEAARIQLKSTEASEFILAIDEIQKITNWSEVVKNSGTKTRVRSIISK